jgi:uncharacterized membrane protein YhdT
MTRYQHAKRIALWRGSFFTLLFCSAWMIASAYAPH